MTTKQDAATEAKAPKKAKTPKRQSEKDLVAKYDGIVEGSLRFVDDAAIKADGSLAPYRRKQIVTRVCPRSDAEFTVATSDLWQCEFHPDERKAVKKEQAKARRERAKQAEALLAGSETETEAVSA